MDLPTTYARLEARIPVEVHKMIKHAAGLEGRTMTDFVIKALSDAAHQTIEQTGIIRLSMADQQRFVESLLEPTEVTPAMAAALELRKQVISK